jgi:hypothetical protein
VNRELAELLMRLTRRLGTTIVAAIMAAVLVWLLFDAAQDARRYLEAAEAERKPALPIELLGGTADFYLRNLGFGAVLFVLFMAMAASGREVPPQPEFDTLGEDLERRNERTIQLGAASFVMLGMLGFAAVIATGKLGWLGVFAGTGMLLYIVVPVLVVLPGGRKRWRELMYFSERAYGRNSIWSWILAAMWSAGAVAAIAGGWVSL